MIDQFGLQSDAVLPFVHNPYAWVACASLLALSSAWEGPPTVLVEAMVCSTPVGLTDCPSGPSEILEGGGLGPLVPVGNAKALAEAFVKTLDAPLGAEGLRRMAGDFNLERLVDQNFRLLPDGDSD